MYDGVGGHANYMDILTNPMIYPAIWFLYCTF